MKIVLAVLYRGEPRMVGKVFGIGPGGRPPLIFLHRETKASQSHTNLNSPGGVDICVLDYLEVVGVTAIHHQRPTQQETLVAPLSLFGMYAPIQRSDGRERRYLPFSFWEKYHVGDAAIDYRVPWIEDTLVLDPALNTRKPITRIEPGSGTVAQIMRLPGL